jgi:glucan phosphoethanolaminetransferase (alkaline phosphatase superfamily)
VSWALRVGTAAALGIDAAVHLRNASGYDAVKATFTEGGLFRAEAGVAIAAGLLVLIWPRRIAWVAALLVSASALAAVLVYRYIDIGQLGPIPTMYENTWQVSGKLLSAYAEGAAVVLAGLGLLVHWDDKWRGRASFRSRGHAASPEGRLSRAASRT